MTKSDVEHRPASASDVVAFYGHEPVCRMRAFVAVREGVPIAIYGVYWHEGRPIVFSSLKPPMRKQRKSIVKGIRILMDFIDRLGLTVLALADENEATAPRLLCLLGFKPTGVVTSKGEFLIREANACPA